MKLRKVLSVKREVNPPYWIDYSSAVVADEYTEVTGTVAEFENDEPTGLDELVGDDMETLFSNGFWFVTKDVRMFTEVLYRVEE